jgi:DNA-directed RNA polymerase subunit K/omega
MSHKARSYFGHGGGDSDEENEDEVASDSEASGKGSDTDDGGDDNSEKGQEDEYKVEGDVDDDDMPVSDGEGDGDGDDDASVANANPDDEEDNDDAEDDDDDDDEAATEEGSDAEGGEEESEAEAAKRQKKQSRQPSIGANPDLNTILGETVNNANGDDDSDEENDENYLQKFNADLNKSYILEHHPECVVQNYNEILALCVVVRDKWNDIVDPLHRTCPYLSKYERTRVIGQRAKQINSGAPTFVKVPETIIDGYLIAEMELEQKKIPFIIRRPLPNGASEYWRISDLENISF